MKFKVGDRVKIISKEQVSILSGGMSGDLISPILDELDLNTDMQNSCGWVSTISGISKEGNYTLIGSNYYWSSWMLELDRSHFQLRLGDDIFISMAGKDLLRWGVISVGGIEVKLSRCIVGDTYSIGIFEELKLSRVDFVRDTVGYYIGVRGLKFKSLEDLTALVLEISSEAKKFGYEIRIERSS
jgi:hypothetical protein